MRVALINPPLFNNVYHFFPIGLGYIAGALKEAGIDYTLLDARLENWSEEKLVEHIKAQTPYDCFAIGGLISSFSRIQAIARALRLEFPHTPIVIGGKVAKVGAQLLFDACEPDYIIDGEGEEALPQLLAHIAGEPADLAAIPGLIRKQNGAIAANPPQNVKDINPYRIPYQDFPMERYVSRDSLQSNGLKSINMISSRGCPYECTFCNFSDGTSGRPLRTIDVQAMEEDIAYLKDNFGLEHIFFNDDVFAMNTQRLSQMGEILQRLGIRYTISMRLDALNEERIRILEDTGCKVMLVGVESASPKILEIIDKRVNLDKYRRNIVLCQESKLIISFNFICGYYGETEETLRETRDFLMEHRILYTSFYATAYPGTKLYDMIRDRIPDEEEYIRRLSRADLQTDYVLNMSELPEKRLRRIRDKMVVRSALNCLTPNPILQKLLWPACAAYWGIIKLNNSRIWQLRRLTDLLNWAIVKPILTRARKR